MLMWLLDRRETVISQCAKWTLLCVFFPAALCAHSGQGSMALCIISDEKTLILPGWLTRQEQVCQSSGFGPPGALTTCPGSPSAPCTDTLLASIDSYNHFYWILFHIWMVARLGIRSLLPRSGGSAAVRPRCHPPSPHSCNRFVFAMSGLRFSLIVSINAVTLWMNNDEL